MVVVIIIVVTVTLKVVYPNPRDNNGTTTSTTFDESTTTTNEESTSTTFNDPLDDIVIQGLSSVGNMVKDSHGNLFVESSNNLYMIKSDGNIVLMLNSNEFLGSLAIDSDGNVYAPRIDGEKMTTGVLMFVTPGQANNVNGTIESNGQFTEFTGFQTTYIKLFDFDFDFLPIKIPSSIAVKTDSQNIKEIYVTTLEFDGSLKANSTVEVFNLLGDPQRGYDIGTAYGIRSIILLDNYIYGITVSMVDDELVIIGTFRYEINNPEANIFNYELVIKYLAINSTKDFLYGIEEKTENSITIRKIVKFNLDLVYQDDIDYDDSTPHSILPNGEDFYVGNSYTLSRYTLSDNSLINPSILSQGLILSNIISNPDLDGDFYGLNFDIDKNRVLVRFNRDGTQINYELPEGLINIRQMIWDPSGIYFISIFGPGGSEIQIFNTDLSNGFVKIGKTLTGPGAHDLAVIYNNNLMTGIYITLANGIAYIPGSNVDEITDSGSYSNSFNDVSSLGFTQITSTPGMSMDALVYSTGNTTIYSLKGNSIEIFQVADDGVINSMVYGPGSSLKVAPSLYLGLEGEIYKCDTITKPLEISSVTEIETSKLAVSQGRLFLLKYEDFADSVRITRRF